MSSCGFIRILPVLLVGVVAGSACAKAPAVSGASDPTLAASPAALAAMPAHAAASPASPATEPGQAGAAPTSATGTIAETMDAGGYTYIRLDTGTGEIWAATNQVDVKVGQQVTVPLDMPMRNFHSAKLGRDFPLVYFAATVSRDGKPLQPTVAATGQAGSGGQALPQGHPPVGSGSSPPASVTEVIKPPAGGYSVASLWTDRAALAGRTVVVRGKVVKFLGGIMGRNWLHLQDGTGKASDGTNDITVTTADEAKPGDVVTATGTLAIDKDFGAGYRYGAIIEGAALSR